MSGENPESMGDVSMDQAMSYTSQATDQAQQFNQQQVQDTENKVQANQTEELKQTIE